MFYGAEPNKKLKLLVKKLSAGNNTTFLISSHDLSHTTEACSRIAVLNKGALVKDLHTDPETLHELEQYFAAQINEFHS